MGMFYGELSGKLVQSIGNSAGAYLVELSSAGRSILDTSQWMQGGLRGCLWL